MLIDNLYKPVSFNAEAGKIHAVVDIDTGHKIFEGHFPQQPVLPGVCQLQLIKELVEKASNKKLFMHAAPQCKFLSMVDPTQTNTLSITIDYTPDGDTITATAAIKSNDIVFLKMSGMFRQA